MAQIMKQCKCLDATIASWKAEVKLLDASAQSQCKEVLFSDWHAYSYCNPFWCPLCSFKKLKHMQMQFVKEEIPGFHGSKKLQRAGL